MFRKRLSYPDLKRQVKRSAAHYHATVILIEDTVSGQALIADLRDERAGLRPIAVRPKGDKVERMSTASYLMEAGQVYVPTDAPWLPDFQQELLAFPSSRYDDQVDSVSQFLIWVRDRKRNVAGSARAIGTT